jgi:hypothetical protein
MFEVEHGQFTGRVSVRASAWQDPASPNPTAPFSEWIGTTKFPIKNPPMPPARGVIPADIRGIYRATELRRSIAEESEGIIPFDADLPVHFEEDVVFIALRYLKVTTTGRCPASTRNHRCSSFHLRMGSNSFGRRNLDQDVVISTHQVMKGNPSTKPFPMHSHCYGRSGTVVVPRRPNPGKCEWSPRAMDDGFGNYLPHHWA